MIQKIKTKKVWQTEHGTICLTKDDAEIIDEDERLDMLINGFLEFNTDDFTKKDKKFIRAFIRDWAGELYDLTAQIFEKPHECKCNGNCEHGEC